MASLTQRTGPLGRRLAAHLLRRCSYHVNFDRIDEFASKTADEAVEELFTFPALLFPDGPLSWHDGTPIHRVPATDENLGIGSLFEFNDFEKSTYLWLFYETLNDLSIRMKLTYWIHSLFVTRFSSPWCFYNWSLCEKMTQGTLKELAVKMTLDTQMLRFLDNTSNNAGNPNENYAREFFELFTILKGEQVSTEDYTNYTELDIGEAARLLTGFKEDFERLSIDPETNLPRGRADFFAHDTESKTFSAAFNNTTIAGATSSEDMFRELQDFVDMVYDQLETARAFVRRMYIFFVSEVIDPEIEVDIIEPLAIQLQNDGYTFHPTLKRLLKSIHFFDEDDNNASDEIIGGKIKSPLELYQGSVVLWDADRLDMSRNNANYKVIFQEQHRFVSEMMPQLGMDPFGPPSVEGFPGFYKAPVYSSNWYDSTTSYYRYAMGQSLERGKIRGNNTDIPFQVDMVAFVEQNIENPADATALVTKLLEYMFPYFPDAQRFDYFLNKLLMGMNPSTWSDLWNAYVGNGNDTEVRVSLNNLFRGIMESAEYQTF